ncbi:hypothetical protein LTR99_008485 [Exophiala xenobiotica]|uniref:Uncharacterized protein n=1 Tax=Vermiconidia calcicola TaxID=1690605 RepID=A0AAV9PZT5_9PEZI|nr:hypothetical protein LTR96_004548 [Exophiala xenobiotica]KAK5532875.1 hypothetical protein LTR25_007579 [Vermiconidia calcicola]KAK5546604.1 hypothetical protein LTR23_003351 [Chaetothyriales sp. CCFEE 6169]KAK5296844.1 hypothetical protein LTR99_008485 [Exophiala xenobiotica]KAK5340170.1 hypothetical protein LTR98_003291 [Exophiala xenobiotica]
MVTSPNVQAILSGDANQKAAIINHILGEIHSVLAGDEDISKLVRYKVKERGENDRTRLGKILDFVGPDEDTLHLLSTKISAWTTDPAAFWMRPVPCFLGQIAAPAQIVGCYIQSKRDDA